jgi:DNA-binding transcriptional MerR regulator/effector-binding domain-containing protein
MANPPLLRTGEFARASSLSTKALRLYHQMGVLVPAVVDPNTGYRAYSPAQLTDAAIIRLLREIDVSLHDIHAILEARDIDLVHKVLTEQAERFQAGLDVVARVIDDLSIGEQVNPAAVVRRTVPESIVFAVDGSPAIADLASFLIRSSANLHEAALASGAVVTGCFGACFPAQIDDNHQDVTAFLPIAAAVLVPVKARGDGVRIDELQACDVAVLEHRGPLWELESSYRRLGTWVAFHGVSADLPVRELYWTPIDESAEDAVTELQWPIVAEPGG